MENLEVRAEVPGFNEKEIEISIEPRRLTITGKRETEKKEEKKGKTFTRNCARTRSCELWICLRVSMPRKATATLKNGVLRLTMPKAARAKTIEIKPKAA